jgi:MATE family multidrug resistance protein
MNVTGVALGTVCAQYLSIILGIWFLHKEFRVHMFQFNLSELLEPKSLKKFLSVNRDIFIRTMTLVFSLAFFTAQSAKFGDSLLAVNTILLQLILVLSYGIDGFAYAAESLTGKYIGAKRNAELRRLIRYLFYWSLGLGVVVALGYFAFYDRLFLIFTNKNELLQLSYDYKLWLVAAPIINGFSYIWDGIYIGAADGKALRNAMLFCTFVIYLPTYYLLGSFWGNQALWLAFTLFMISRGATLWWYAGYRIKVWLTA